MTTANLANPIDKAHLDTIINNHSLLHDSYTLTKTDPRWHLMLFYTTKGTTIIELSPKHTRNTPFITSLNKKETDQVREGIATTQTIAEKIRRVYKHSHTSYDTLADLIGLTDHEIFASATDKDLYSTYTQTAPIATENFTDRHILALSHILMTPNAPTYHLPQIAEQIRTFIQGLDDKLPQSGDPAKQGDDTPSNADSDTPNNDPSDPTREPNNTDPNTNPEGGHQGSTGNTDTNTNGANNNGANTGNNTAEGNNGEHHGTSADGNSTDGNNGQNQGTNSGTQVGLNPDTNPNNSTDPNNIDDIPQATSEQTQEQAQNQDEEDPQHPMTHIIKATLQAGEHPYLYGHAGTGKSYLTAQVAKQLGYDYYYTGAITDEFTGLKGFTDANGTKHHTEFTRALHNSQHHPTIFVIDEIDASTPEVLTTLNNFLAGGSIEIHGQRHSYNPNLHIIACANTTGKGGDTQYIRQTHDSATLDRFTHIHIDYDPTIENHIAKGNRELTEFTQAMRKASTELEIPLLCTYRFTVKMTKLEKALTPKTVMQSTLLPQLDHTDAQTINNTLKKTLDDNKYVRAFTKAIKLHYES